MRSAEQIVHLKTYETNPNYSKNINRPLSSLLQTIKPWDKIGLILGHGHNYSNDIYTKLRFVNYWYMIDIDKTAFPDYICDLTDPKQLEYFSDNIFDYIYDSGFTEEKFMVYDYCKRLLKPNGTFILLNGISWRNYIDDTS